MILLIDIGRIYRYTGGVWPGESILTRQRSMEPGDMTTFTIDSNTWRSPNFNFRPANTDIWAIVDHSCEGRPAGNEQQSSLPWLCNPASDVSCHYYVTREGVIYQLVDDDKRAWHAGVSVLNGVWDCNDYSIGIEREHRDNAAAYPQIQIDAMTWLCRRLIAAYAIPKNGIATHRKVAKAAGRTDKYDPTDIDDAPHAAWVDSLYAPTDPLRARTLPGPPGSPAAFCSAGAWTFYTQRGGLTMCGYPLRDEFPSMSQSGQPCSVLCCERVIIKSSNGYGTEQALLSEARTVGWLA